MGEETVSLRSIIFSHNFVKLQTWGQTKNKPVCISSLKYSAECRNRKLELKRKFHTRKFLGAKVAVIQNPFLRCSFLGVRYRFVPKAKYRKVCDPTDSTEAARKRKIISRRQQWLITEWRRLITQPSRFIIYYRVYVIGHAAYRWQCHEMIMYTVVIFAILLDVRTFMKVMRNPLGPHVPVNANH